jgi:hypothetical protein
MFMISDHDFMQPNHIKAKGPYHLAMCDELTASLKLSCNTKFEC